MKNIRNIIEQKYPPENPNDLWMKDNVLYKSTHKGWTPLTAGGGSSTNGVTSTTWLELKDKRDAGKLTPGALYRITDYNCTTTQENTKSAGHQFDIVLLALSENKLAEEGWAMMHIDNIYKVVFDDNEVVSCYVTPIANHANRYYVVNVDTLLGSDMTITSDRIDEDNNIITLIEGWTPDVLVDPDLPYNYFQNSNLSAWKVWYCLDNDTARFAWADDRLILHEIMISGSPQDYIRTPESDLTIDGVKYYAWVWSSSPEFTLSETPKHGDALYGNFGGMQEIGEVDKVFTKGRGVIYRLIDEWNNDCPYDFKNIVIYHGGKIEEGYLFSSDDGDIFSDMSLTGIFNDIIVKKTIDDNNCQVIDIGIFVTNGVVGYCNVIVASGALSENGVNTLSSNVIFGYTII